MKKNLRLLVFLLCISTTAFAQFKFLPDVESQKATGAEINTWTAGWPYSMPNTVINEFDYMHSNWSTWTNDFEFKSARDIVRVRVNHDVADIVAAYKYKVVVDIYKFVPGMAYTMPTGLPTPETKILYLEYDPAVREKYNDLSVYSFTGCYKFQVKITAVYKETAPGVFSPVATTDIAKNFFIESEIQTQRYDKAIMYINTFSTKSTDNRNLEVYGALTSSPSSLGTPPLSGAPYKPAAYELEWTYIDDYQYNTSTGAKSYAFTTASSIAYDFRKNSTRIQLDQPIFNIPLIYEHGAVIFRMRMLRPKLADYKTIEYGEWTLPDNGTLSTTTSGANPFNKYGTLITTPHTSDSLNWQYTINFAEQGKYKHVINYFDGALKDRQTQTKINSDAANIVAVDKVYDFEGRPSIVSLPTPVPQQQLYFRSDILINNSTSKPYRANDFDLFGCSRPGAISPLANTASANIYYSTLNPDKSGMQKFVPDAEGFPLVQTVYSPDNTNKVSWQGGAGKEQQLVEGHGTQYEYVRARQPELDKYLGTEAGYDRYYPKQIVTDPNGQSSYSILNPQGKVVISALQGDAPDPSKKPIDKLDNFVVGEEMCTDLLKNQEQNLRQDGRDAFTSLYNDAPGKNTLKYKVTTYPFATGCSDQYLWTTGYYDIKTTDDCGKQYNLLSTSGTVVNSAASISAWGATTGAAPGKTTAETSPILSDADVPKGKILVNKQLSFSQYDIRNQVRGFLKHNEPTCYNPEEQFIREAVLKGNFPCNTTTEESSTPPDPCDVLREEMISQMYPGAKYGAYLQGEDGNFISHQTNSIFENLSLTLATSTSRQFLVRTGYSPTAFTSMIAIPTPTTADPTPTLNKDPQWFWSLDGGATYTKDAYPCLDYSSIGLLYGNDISPSPKVSPYTNITDRINPAVPDYHKPLYFKTTFPTPAGLSAATKIYAFVQAHNHQIISYKVNGVENVPFSNPLYGDEKYDLKGLNPPGEDNTIIIVVATNDPITNPGSIYGAATMQTHIIANEPLYRYQLDCITYPTITYKGKTYTNADIKKLSPQEFINIFNRKIAEALLPLHPEYCKLLNCELFTGEFENKFLALESFQEAEAAGLFTLSDILAADPLHTYLNSSTGGAAVYDNNALKYFPYSEKHLLKISTSTSDRLYGDWTIDKLAITNTYCGAGNDQELRLCATDKYAAEIAAFSFTTDELKQQYFEQLRNLYMTNRYTVKQKILDYLNSKGGCSTCNEDNARMTLIAPALFLSMDKYPSTATGASKSSTLDDGDALAELPDWKKDLYKGKTTTLPPPELSDATDALKSEKADVEASAIMQSLQHCPIPSLDRDLLFNTLKTAIVTGTKITPEYIKDKIVAFSSGGAAALNELCNPFLVNYNLFPDPQQLNNKAAKYACGVPATYTALKDFLNRSDIKTAIANAATTTSGYAAGSISLASGATELPLRTALGLPSGGTANVTAYKKTLSSCSTCDYVQLEFKASGNTAYLNIQAQNINTITDIKTFASPVSSTYYFDDIKCLNDEPSANNQGLIAQKTAAISATCSTCTTPARYYVWTSFANLMTSTPDAASLNDAITCRDIKTAIENFSTDKATYAYTDNAHHPYFEQTLNNYLNYKFNKQFSYPQYRALMDGCALSDKLSLPRATTHYRVECSSDANADLFTTQLNTLSGVSAFKPGIFRFKESGNTYLYIDLSPVEPKDLLSYKNYLASTSLAGTVVANYTHTNNLIFTPTTCSITAGLLPSGTTTATIPVWEKGTYRDYTRYSIPNPSNPKDIADMQAGIVDYLNNTASCAASYRFWNTELLRSADYSNPLRQAYLTYIYALTYPSSSFITSIAPGALTALPGYSSSTFTYNDPYCAGNRMHLYAYNPNPTIFSSADAFPTLRDDILPAATSAGATPFPNASITDKTTTLGTSLKVIRKANGHYWYQYFDDKHRMYNTYIVPPGKKFGRPLSDYQFSLSTLKMGQHPHTFTITATAPAKSAMPAISITCQGYTDYDLYSTQIATNIILSQQDLAPYDSLDCESELLSEAIRNGKAAYYQYFENNLNTVSAAFMKHLIATTEEELTYCGRQQQYQQTLYFYDRVGNLTRTVPPAGIVPLPTLGYSGWGGTTYYGLDDAAKYRDNPNQYYIDHSPALLGDDKLTRHNKVSEYRYNSLNQLIYQRTPDGGTTLFFYDAAGRQIFSQNSKQRKDGLYTYSLYDEQGRPMESGQVKLGCTYASGVDFDLNPCDIYFKRKDGTDVTTHSAHPDFVTYSYDETTYSYDELIYIIRNKARSQVVTTHYDNPTIDLGSLSAELLSEQENLRSRVAAIKYYNEMSPTWALPAGTTMPDATFATYYSYDLSGNVQTITYDYPKLGSSYALRYIRIDYDYDLVSGKVNMISYNRAHPDQFYQQYNYDADNRITQVKTSNDGIIWNTDAQYKYYQHGPLAQLQIGNQKIQSIEYAYTIQGWLKAINGDLLNPDLEMGKNGLSGDYTYPRDVVAHALRYFNNDYKAIGTTPAVSLPIPGTPGGGAAVKDLYNGNISQQTTGIEGHGTLQRSYQYDQLQRLKLATYANVNDATAAVSSTTPAELFKNSYNYDMDGNITKLQRWDGDHSSPNKIDELNYAYQPGSTNNKLLQVADAATVAPTVGMDLQPGQAPDNYSYDPTGNLIADKQAHEQITWDRFGKVTAIRNTLNNRYIAFAYDGKGNRIWKEVIKPIPGAADEHEGEYYLRDAGGNILSTYRTHSKYNRATTLTTLTALPFPGGPTTLISALSALADRSYPTALRSLMLASHSSFVATYTAKPVSYYLDADPALRTNLLYSGDAWIDALRAADPSVPSTAFLKAGNEVQPLFYAALDRPVEGKQLLKHYSEQMPRSDCQSIWSIEQAEYRPGEHDSNATRLYNAIQAAPNHKPAIIDALVSAISENYNSEGTEAQSYYDAVIADNSLWQSVPLRAQNGQWTVGIRSIIDQYAPPSAIATFFDAWSGGSAALTACTTPEYKLTAVYEHDPLTALRDMSTEASASERVDVLTAMPDLTIHEFAGKLIDAGAPAPLINDVITMASSGDTISLAEHHIYGSSRLGVQRYDSIAIANILRVPSSSLERLTLKDATPWYSYHFADIIQATKRTPYEAALTGNAFLDNIETSRTLGRRYYEMTDHLGNVLATVLDRKTGTGSRTEPITGAALYDHWSADLASTADYYPGGMMMPNRNTEYSWSRMGYNGQAKDDEVYGKGNLNTALFWEMDTRRLGRWNNDPVINPSVSPYALFDGNPIWKNDVLGNTATNPDIVEVDKKQKTFTTLKETDDPYDVVVERKTNENGDSVPVPNSKDGVPIHYQKGEYQKYLKANGYVEKAPLRGAQAEEFAVEMAVLDGVGKVIAKGFGWAWSKVFSGSTEVTVTTSAEVAVTTSTETVTEVGAYELEMTHGLTKSKSAFAKLKADIKINGIKEPIKFVEHNGKKYVVDGHHRLRAAKELGIQNVPVQQVELPYAGYKSVADLIYTPY